METLSQTLIFLAVMLHLMKNVYIDIFISVFLRPSINHIFLYSGKNKTSADPEILEKGTLCITCFGELNIMMEVEDDKRYDPSLAAGIICWLIR